MTHSLPFFVAMLVPGAIGIGLCNATLSALISNAAGTHEQGRVQGAAGALESLGRTIGPVWGNGALQCSARASRTVRGHRLLGAAAMTLRYQAPAPARYARARPRTVSRLAIDRG